MIDSNDAIWLVASISTAWVLGYGLGWSLKTFRQAADVVL